MNSYSIGVYGELARYPLYIQRYYRIIKYWCTLRQSNNIILIKLYDSGLADCLLGRTNWISNVKTLLDDYGFLNVFTAANSDVLNTFPLLFKQRVALLVIPHFEVDILIKCTLYYHLFLNSTC